MPCRVEHDDPTIVGLRGSNGSAAVLYALLKGGQVCRFAGEIEVHDRGPWPRRRQVRRYFLRDECVAPRCDACCAVCCPGHLAVEKPSVESRQFVMVPTVKRDASDTSTANPAELTEWLRHVHLSGGQVERVCEAVQQLTASAEYFDNTGGDSPTRGEFP